MAGPLLSSPSLPLHAVAAALVASGTDFEASWSQLWRSLRTLCIAPGIFLSSRMGCNRLWSIFSFPSGLYLFASKGTFSPDPPSFSHVAFQSLGYVMKRAAALRLCPPRWGKSDFCGGKVKTPGKKKHHVTLQPWKRRDWKGGTFQRLLREVPRRTESAAGSYAPPDRRAAGESGPAPLDPVIGFKFQLCARLRSPGFIPPFVAAVTKARSKTRGSDDPLRC